MSKQWEFPNPDETPGAFCRRVGWAPGDLVVKACAYDPNTKTFRYNPADASRIAAIGVPEPYSSEDDVAFEDGRWINLCVSGLLLDDDRYPSSRRWPCMRLEPEDTP